MALYAFDGTWNSSVVGDGVEGEEDTNVVHFYEAYDGPKWYVAGPGTRVGELGRTLGGLTGAGARQRLEEAYAQLRKDYAAGERVIDIVGFSRGAAIALDFANRINDRGIRDEETDAVIADDVQIRFLGLWDVVGAFGIPWGEAIFQQLNIGHQLSVPTNVEYAFHALSIDDRRQSFRPTRQVNAYEVWFRGVHSDVGGGNGHAGLSCIALRWMFSKARAAGLPLDETAACSHDRLIDPTAALYVPSDPVRDPYREFWPNDRIHYTVSERADCNNPPPDFPRESEEDEKAAVRRADLPHRVPPPRAQRPLPPNIADG